MTVQLKMMVKKLGIVLGVLLYLVLAIGLAATSVGI
jgi:hypothetical protein